MRLVLIEWVDSFGCSSSWQDLDDQYKTRPMICHSVGWLFRDDEDVKVVVPHLADVPNDVQQGCGDMTIPTSAIIRIQDLQRDGKHLKK